jgi:predicted ATPase/DNA-binding CsgD family transcriptional regulator
MFRGRSGTIVSDVSGELQRPVRWSHRPRAAPVHTIPEVVLPVGTATLLAADADADAEGGAHVAAVRELAGRHGGVSPFDPPSGPAIAAFARASDALACAVELVAGDDSVRVALHTGELDVAPEGAYLGPAVARTMKLLELAHPGQLLLSRATHDLVIDVLPDAIGLLDLGEHRLAEVGRREHVWQVLHPRMVASFPALRSAADSPSNLPMPLNRLIGRDQEVADVASAMATSRLVTLTGVGGTGKTRLALHIAGMRGSDHPDGRWFVELAALEDPGDLVDQVLRAIGVPDSPDLVGVDALLSHLGDRRVLLVVDNCEHIVADVAVLVSSILERCEHVTVLATSREPLGVRGEVVIRVPSLATPPPSPWDLAGLDRYAAVELFCARAAQAIGAFTVDDTNADDVAEICRRLDGIPLAIELAAARVSVLSPRQIADGLHDQFRLLAGGTRVALPRQQTIEASVDWSYALLTEHERLVLRRLAVLPGEFGLEAAEHVCSLDGVARHHVFDALGQLVDKSLVIAVTDGREARYRLLETIRQYAARHLVAAEETDSARERLLAFVESMTGRWRDALVGHGQLEARDALECEVPSIVSALTWAIDAGHTVRAAGVLLEVFPLWDQIGAPPDLWRLYDDLLGADGLDGPTRGAIHAACAAATFPGGETVTHVAAALDENLAPRWRAVALVYDGACAVLDSSNALSTFDAAVRAAEESGESWLVAMAMTMRGVSRFDDLATAAAEIEAALALALEAGHLYEARRARTQLGDLQRRAGRLREARMTLEACIADQLRGRESLADAQVTTFLGNTLIELGEVDAARAVLLASRDRWHGVGFGEHKAIEGLAYAAIADDDPAQAIAAVEEFARSHPNPVMRAGAAVELVHGLLAQGDARRARAALDMLVTNAGAFADTALFAADVSPLRVRAALLAGDLLEAEQRAHEELEVATTHDLPRLQVFGLEHLAEMLVASGSPLEGARLAGAAASGRAAMGWVALPYERRSQEAAMAAARGALGDDELERALAEGAAMSLSDATDYARRGRGSRLRPKSGWSSLTPAEVRVADLVAEGLTNPQIGQRLFISAKTVRSHLSNIFAKLGISSRSQLAGEVTKRRMS